MMAGAIIALTGDGSQLSLARSARHRDPYSLCSSG